MVYQESSYFEPDVEEIHRQSLCALLVALIVAGLGILAVFSDNRASEPVVVGFAFGFGALAAACTWLMQRSLLLSGVLLSFGLLAIASVAVVVGPTAVVLHFMPLIILCATAVLGAVGGIGSFVTLVLVLVCFQEASLVTGEEAAVTVVSGSVTLILSWLVTRPALISLEWSWMNFAYATQARDELERRQGELTRTLHGLNVAQNRLEQLNQELAWAREAAEEARRLKAEFAANISHELRTPLNHIIGFSEVMISAPETYGGDVLPDSYRGDVEAIYRSAHHLSQLIDDVLDLSQIEAARMGLAKTSVRVCEVIDEAIAVVHHFLESKGLALNVAAPTDLPQVFVDRTRIRQVLINLLGNAARFTDEGGITIRATYEEHDVIVSVEDTGPGIPHDDLPKVFEEFRQLDGSSSRRHGGSGLGLAISKRFVELHGGSIWAESEVGRGSRFNFSIPVASGQNVVTTPYSGEAPFWSRLAAEWSSSRKTLAVISDDPALARVIHRFLDGFEVIVSDSVAEVSAWHVEHRVDALLLAAESTRDGLRQVEEVRHLPTTLPVITCSIPARRDRAKDLEVASYLVKPVDREALLKEIGRLGRPASRVLVVDDDPDTLRLFARILQSEPGRERYRVSTATSGTEALAQMRRYRPDVVILDLLMPDTGGYEVLAAMRCEPELQDIPTIVISAQEAREETAVADAVAMTRPGGLAMGELLNLIRTGLDNLTTPLVNDLESPGAHPGAPAFR